MYLYFLFCEIEKEEEKMESNFKISLIGLNSGHGHEVKNAEEIANKFSKKSEDVFRNGVTKLYFLSKQENLIDFTSQITSDLLQKLGIDLSKIKGVFGSNNQTADFLIPAFTACVSNKLGLRNVICDQVGLGCSGGLQALRNAYNQAVVDSMNGILGYYLVVVGDQLGRLLDPEDFGMSILFSEGSAVLVLTNRPDEEGGYKIEKIRTKSLLGKHLWALRIKNPYSNNLGEIPKFEMNGLEVFQFAINTFPDILDLIGLQSIGNETYFIPHQANLRIIDKIIKNNELNPNNVYSDGIKTIGNVASASVFFGLHDALKRNLLDKNYKVVLGAFGAELQIGAALLLPQGAGLMF